METKSKVKVPDESIDRPSTMRADPESGRRDGSRWRSAIDSRTASRVYDHIEFE